MVGAALVNVIGSTASLMLTQSLTFDERSTPLAHKLKFGLVVYLISAALFYVGPGLLLWKVYRGVIGALCAPLTTVDPSSLRLTCPPSGANRARVILVLAGLALLILGILVAIGYRVVC